MLSINETISRLPHPIVPSLSKPKFTGPKLDSRRRIALAVESMRNHMTDEGWQIFEGLQHSGYYLCGWNLPYGITDCNTIIRDTNPSTIIVQDKREWDVAPRDFREHNARFYSINSLKERDDILKLTILKDSHQKPLYHRESAEEMGCHAWIIYYNNKIVSHLAPYTRPQHLIRTYHTINSLIVPPYTSNNREHSILSGAVSSVYPLRQKLIDAYNQGRLPDTSITKHPGYHRNGTCTPGFIAKLSRYKVSICTASIYGYALRKIIESTAAGCVVITDLPKDEVLPHIDGNLYRVKPDISPEEIRTILNLTAHCYDPDKQEHYAFLAKKHYDYKIVTHKLTEDIENLRRRYNDS